jgi:hypothetical protein
MLWMTDDPQLLLLLFRTLLNMNHNVQKTKDKGTNDDLQNTNTAPRRSSLIAHSFTSSYAPDIATSVNALFRIISLTCSTLLICLQCRNKSIKGAIERYDFNTSQN